MTTFAQLDRLPARLDEPHLIRKAVALLIDQDFDRATIERALIEMMPVDLDLLAACFLEFDGAEHLQRVAC
ncbi:hypothetical protein [Consotaella salsifontis]|nr:hypothetical protein [Consotaella salsifontis]